MSSAAPSHAVPTHRLTVRIIGPGRAGRSFAAALVQQGAAVDLVDRAAPIDGAADGVDLVLLCVPDGRIPEVAATIAPGDAVVAHCAGSRTLDVLEPHVRRASIHPLMSLPDPEIGAARLLDHCHFAVAGDPIASELVTFLGGVALQVPEADRALYHAAASIAANHLVALCAQVETIARELELPPAAFWELMATTFQNVRTQGAAASVTGPAARGDWETIRSHLAVLDPDERAGYRALAQAAAHLGGRNWPDDL